MTSHSPASSPELPKLPDLPLDYYAADHVRAYATSYGLACYEAGRASVASVAVPEEIHQIAERLHTQDNRITDNPLFAVQQKRRFGGVDSEYADASVWISDGCEVDAEEAARLDALLESGGTVPDDCQRMGYIDRWEFVTGCFTEQGCTDYIARNGHNLHEPRIYAYGSYRNAEFIALRKWLMSLPSAPAAALVAASDLPQAAPEAGMAAKQVAERVVKAIEQAYNDTEQSVPRDFCGEASDAAYGAVMDALTATPASPQAPAPQAADDAFAALRALTEAMLTRADNDYMLRQLDAAVKVMAKRGCEPPVPWPDADFFVSRCEASTAPSAAPHQVVEGDDLIEWGDPIRISDIAIVPQRLDGKHTEYARRIAAALSAPHQGADALRDDADRLDWIERHVCDVSRLGDSARTLRISWANGADYAFVGPRYNATWREAIDAARAALAQHQAPQQGEEQ